MDLKGIRRSIDALDCEVVRLFNRRIEYALRLKRLKGSIAEPQREEEVLQHVRGYASPLCGPDLMEKVYKTIMERSREVQGKPLQLVGFQGEHGAYSEVAAQAYGFDLVPIPCEDFREVFAEVSSGQLDFGIVPVENSLEGAVTEVNDLLVETDLKIVGEARIPIHHCLLALPEQDYRDLRLVYSHPQALAQCRGFIVRHKLEPRPYYDTAGAAIMLREQRPSATAIIASALCAELYELQVIKENIEDHDSNTTRFLVLGKEPSREKGDKCSVIFSVTHRPGGLFSALQVLNEEGINMTRIESRPLRKNPDRYAFFVDFEGSDKDAKVKRVLDVLEKNSNNFKFLGCYKGAKI